MGDKRKELGYHYSIHVTDQDDELESFKITLSKASGGEYTPVKKALYVDSEAPPDLEAIAREQGIDVDNINYEDELKDTPVSGMGAVGQRPQRTLLSQLDELEREDAEPATKPKKVPAKKVKDDISVTEYKKKTLEDAKKLLKELGDPQGYDREMVVINDTLYKIGLKIDELEKFDSPLEGIFNLDEFTPRLICSSDKVILIELLKPTGEELDTELTQNLSDLTAMFMIEID
jgi:hypothetical protein